MCSDSFLCFATKVRTMTASMKTGQLPFLQERGITFNGVLMNRTLYYSVTAVTSQLDESVEEVLQSIQREIGRNTLTGGATKLATVCRLLS